MSSPEKKVSHSSQYYITFHNKDGKQQSIHLSQGQFLIGSCDKADLTLKYPGIAHYQCLLSFDQEGRLEIHNLGHDLDQVKLNKKGLNREYLNHDDHFSVGQTQFQVNQELTNTSQQGIVYIDNEECDIHFDESKFKISHKIELEDYQKYNFRNFIDDQWRKPFSYLKSSTKVEVYEVLFLSCGNILSYDTIPTHKVKNWKKYLSTDFTDYFGHNFNLIEQDGNALKFNQPKGFERIENNSSEQDPIIFVKGTSQLIIRKGHTPGKARLFFPSRDTKEIQKSLIIFALFFIPFLTLKLIELPEVQPIKEPVVVIYKPKPEVQNEQKETQESSSSSSSKQDEKKEVTKPVRAKQKVVKQQPQPQKQEPKKPSLSAKLGGLFSSKAVEKDFQNKKDHSSQSDQLLAKSSDSKLQASQGKGEAKKLQTSGEFDSKDGFQNKGRSGKDGFSSELSATRTVVVGSIDPELLRQLMREYIPQFRYCYQEELTKNPDLAGIIDLNFTISAAGKISQSAVTAKSGKFSSKGTQCINKVLKMIPFPKPKGGGQVQVRQPLNFSAEKTKL